MCVADPNPPLTLPRSHLFYLTEANTASAESARLSSRRATDTKVDFTVASTAKSNQIFFGVVPE